MCVCVTIVIFRWVILTLFGAPGTVATGLVVQKPDWWSYRVERYPSQRQRHEMAHLRGAHGKAVKCWWNLGLASHPFNDKQSMLSTAMYS